MTPASPTGRRGPAAATSSCTGPAPRRSSPAGSSR
jgi:hypothetical protein